MSPSTPFIHRPIATSLLTLGLAIAGVIAFFLLPVAPLPQVDYPTISVSASLPGASPDTMAATVATPLERALGAIAGVNEITSTSTLGNTRVVLQFDLDREINGAARDVQAAINAARTLLPTGMPGNPTYRKVNPADSPILILSLTSATLTRGQMYDAASTVLAQSLAQVEGVGQVTIGGGALPAVRIELDPNRLAANGIALETVRSVVTSANANRPLGAVERDGRYWQIGANDQARTAAEYAPLVLSYKNGNAVRLQGRGRGDRLGAGRAQLRRGQRQAGHPAADLQGARRQHPGGDGAGARDAAAAQGLDPGGDRPGRRLRPHAHAARLAARGRARAGDRGGAGDPGGVPVPAQRPRRADPERGGAGVAGRHLRRHVPGRLHAGQPLAHGADGGHRLRRGRRHRGAGEHFAPHGARQECAAGLARRRARDRLHRGGP